MRIFIHSCHAVLEYDQAQMFTDLGHEVVGVFDVGSKQRPKIKGITDSSLTDKKDTQKMETDMDLVKGIDVIIVHQMDNFPDRVCEYADSELPVILVAFGQGTVEQHDMVVEAMETYQNIYVVAYSQKDFNKYRMLADTDTGILARIKHIPFAKQDGEYGPWDFEDAPEDEAYAQVLVVGNDIHNRGDACGWPIVKELNKRGIPFLIVGKNTDQLGGGFGEVHYEELKAIYRRVPVALDLGTVPAPYTLSLVEQIMTGTPIIAFDNRFGIVEEEIGVHLVRTVDEAEAALNNALTSKENRAKLHKLSIAAASRFDWSFNSKLWQDLLLSM